MEFVGKALLAVLAAVVYLLPSYIALERQHHMRRLICALNLLLGWTVVGWVVALVMSLTGVRRSVKALDDYFSPP